MTSTWTPSAVQKVMITTKNVHLKDAHKTPQFWLIWAVLCLNVSAGIDIIGAAVLLDGLVDGTARFNRIISAVAERGRGYETVRRWVNYFGGVVTFVGFTCQ